MEQYVGTAKSLKMRFEEKADFVMMLELEDWGKKQKQMKEDEEYERFCQTVRNETTEAYHHYCKYIEESSPWPDFTERLKQMNDVIEGNAEVFKQTKLRDIFPQWSERRGKSSVYDFIINHHLPMIITLSDMSDFVQYHVQYGVYSYLDKAPYIKTGSQESVPSWWRNFKGKSTIKRIEEYFHCTLLKYCQVPARMLRPRFEDYSKRYVESCVFNSRFSYKLKNDSGDKTLTKEKLRLLFEAAYAIESYNKRMNDYFKKYGHIIIGDILKLNDDEASLVKDKHVDSYLSNSFFDLRIERCNHLPNPNEIVVKYCTYCTRFYHDKNLYPSIFIPRINEALNIDIEYSEEITNEWYKSSWYTLSNDIYYARKQFRFLSLKEACGFDEEKIKLKPLMWYYKEIMSWDK